jgi:hypothetical protein
MSLRRSLPLCSLLVLLVLLTIPVVQSLPSSPEGLQATVGEDYVDLCWQPVPDADNYLLYRGNAQEMTLLANVHAPFTAYHDGDLEEGSTLLYYVTAVEGEEESAPGNSISVTVPLKERSDIILPVLAIVLSVIAVQVCVVMLLYFLKLKMMEMK